MSVLPACVWPLVVLFRNFSTNSMRQFPEVTPKYYLSWGLHPREPQVWRRSCQAWNSIRLVRLLFIAWLRFILPIFRLRVSWISWNSTQLRTAKNFYTQVRYNVSRVAIWHKLTSALLWWYWLISKSTSQMYTFQNNFAFHLTTMWYNDTTTTSKCEWEILGTWSVKWRPFHANY